MNARHAKKVLAVALSFILIAAAPRLSYGYQDSGAPATDSGNPTESAPMSASNCKRWLRPSHSIRMRW